MPTINTDKLKIEALGKVSKKGSPKYETNTVYDFSDCSEDEILGLLKDSAQIKYFDELRAMITDGKQPPSDKVTVNVHTLYERKPVTRDPMNAVRRNTVKLVQKGAITLKQANASLKALGEEGLTQDDVA